MKKKRMAVPLPCPKHQRPLVCPICEGERQAKKIFRKTTAEWRKTRAKLAAAARWSKERVEK